MHNDFELYKLYSDENHKYNSIIWQFPAALIGLNILAYEKVVLTTPNQAVLFGMFVFNTMMILFLAKHVYHQGCFTRALKDLGKKLKQEGFMIADFGEHKGFARLKGWRASINLVVFLFLANCVIYFCLASNLQALSK